eukprot:GEZU01039067.1.p1 GENE.GEZU01039067.1~~GEZU01039067.1.p1  ORF type:complete len:160 (-),score=31.66 GEZU01039067.1:56-535(-)
MASIPPEFRKTTLSLYRQIMRLSQHIPNPEQRAKVLTEARTTFKMNKNVTDPERVLVLHHQAQSKLGFIKTITPRVYHVRKSDLEGPVAEKKRYILVDGKIVEEEGESKQKDSRVVSNWTAGNYDPDQVARHEYLLRRQRFQEGPLKGYRSWTGARGYG